MERKDKDGKTILDTKGRGKNKRRRGRSVVTTNQDGLKVIRRRKKKKPIESI